MPETFPLAHVGLTISNLERSRDFYAALFGFREFYRVRRNNAWLAARIGYANADVEFLHMKNEAGLHLELMKYYRPRAERVAPEDTYYPGKAHFSLLVEDLFAMATRITGHLFKMQEPGLAGFATPGLILQMTEIDEGPNRGKKGFYLRDPDGHTIELSE